MRGVIPNALVLAVLTTGAVAAASAAAPPFDSLPLAAPGQFSGRILYVTEHGCQLHQVDLASGEDTTVRAARICSDDAFPLLSNDARFVAYRGSANNATVASEDGKIVYQAPPASRVPRGFSYAVAFSPDSTRFAYCSYTDGEFVVRVVDLTTSRVVSNVRGTCRATLTSRGLAYVKNGRVYLAGKLFYAPRASRLAWWAEGSPLGTTPDGSLLGVTTRPRAKRFSNILAIHVFDLHGRQRFVRHAPNRVPTSMIELGPGGESAVVWWGCIMQLVSFDRSSFSFRYGETGEIVSRPAFSPDGRYAAMPLSSFPLHEPGTPPPQPRGLAILDAKTFDGIARIPGDAMGVAWLP